MMPDNQAAWIPQELAKDLHVGPGPTPNPAENEVVIKVAYAAVNPTDWKMQDEPYLRMDYPWIFGTDIAGIVMQTGSAVTSVRAGQRVIGHCDSLLTRKATNAGFQHYSTGRELLVCPIPDSLPFANAAVLPLSISSAASGLYCELGLPPPSLSPVKTGKTILIWGGSSSVGSSSIQLAVASGLNVMTTVSPSNRAYVEGLGASVVFDYHDHEVVEHLSKHLTKGDLVLDCIGSESSQSACADILSRIGGGLLPILVWPQGNFPDNVKAVIVNGLAPAMVQPEVGQAVWKSYLPAALQSGAFQAKLDPLIVAGGLEKVQAGIDMVRKGVSAKKVVVEILGDGMQAI